jgi:ankyrin repeat protein
LRSRSLPRTSIRGSLRHPRIPRIAKPWLAAILVLALLPWLGCSKEEAPLDELLKDAVANQDFVLAKRVLGKGANANVRGPQGWTALMYATDQGTLDLVKLLIDKGADVNAMSDRGFTALMNAAGKGNLQLLQLLIDKGANTNTETDDGSTALMFAANEGHLEETKLLIEKGADVHAKRRDGATALVGAIGGGGHLEVIKVLVENGADCNTTVMLGVTALRLAEMNGQTEVAEYLKSCGAN